MSLLIQIWQHLMEEDTKIKPISQKKKNKNKTIKGTCFLEGQQLAKKCPSEGAEKSVRITSLGQLFVISTSGLYLHLQILLAFPDTSNLSSEHYPVLRQSCGGVPFCSRYQQQSLYTPSPSLMFVHQSAHLDTFQKLRT